MTVTLRVRSIVWFLTGAGLAVVVTLLFVDALRADAAPGDSDTTFVPITPGCRFADTRQAGQGPAIGPGQVRTFTAHGANNACTIPNDAVGLLMNVTVDSRTAPNSFLTVWGNGNNPGTSALNPAAGQPPTPNAVITDLTAAGQFNIYNDAGFVNVIIDINGYYTKSSLTQLHQRVATLEAKLASVSATTVDGHPTVRFTGVNVQILDGTGDTPCSKTNFEPCNGRGNLIVGYNEANSQSVRSGSHNIAVGTVHSWTSYGGLVAGTQNRITGESSTVTGGFGNEASGQWATVSGGSGNKATGEAAAVSAGAGNSASGDFSAVSGGDENTASGDSSAVSGGDENTASGPSSWVSGGRNNSATALGTSLSGGLSNVASAPMASVTGGTNNVAGGDHSTILGGESNVASNSGASVLGGLDNTAFGPRTVIVGGEGCSKSNSDGVFVGSPGGTTCTQLN